MVDRNANMYEVEVVAPAPFFVEKTILEGELVWKQPQQDAMMYLVFDAVRIKGQVLLDQPFTERIKQVTNVTRWAEEMEGFLSPELESRVEETSSIVIVQRDPPIVMKPKRFIESKHVSKLWNMRSDAEHRVDGIILMCDKAKYSIGMAKRLSAIKWKDHSTIDLRGTPDALHCSDVKLPTTLHGKSVCVTPCKIVGMADDIVEYCVSIAEDTIALHALRMRTDKQFANSLLVVQRTIGNIIESIAVSELGTPC